MGRVGGWGLHGQEWGLELREELGWLGRGQRWGALTGWTCYKGTKPLIGERGLFTLLWGGQVWGLGQCPPPCWEGQLVIEPGLEELAGRIRECSRLAGDRRVPGHGLGRHVIVAV